MDAHIHSPKPSWGSSSPLGTPAPQYTPMDPFNGPRSRSTSPPSSPSPILSPASLARFVRKRRYWPLVALFFTLAVSWLLMLVWIAKREECTSVQGMSQHAAGETDSRLDGRNWVNGPPMPRLADNLKPEVKYITTWISAGWTNDVMTYGNLLYLALLTQRVPILGPFIPSHLNMSAGNIPFGEMFDVPRLAREMGWPVLEWKDVKMGGSTENEEIGCWSSWMGTSRGISAPKGSWMPNILNLDISYTPVPYENKMYPDNDNEPHLTYGKLMQLGFPTGRQHALTQSTPRPTSKNNAIQPSDQLMCFDQLYAVSLDKQWEWFQDSSPVWRFVGRHMHWNPTVVALANRYLARHFGTPEDQPIPPYISVHARRGDFGNYCRGMGRNGTECLPTMRQLKRRIAEVQSGLAMKGIETDRVVVTSDEKDPAWWEEVRENGYTWIDHEQEGTNRLYGDWYAPLLDALFHSLASGFVGTDQSTMSLIAARRVEEWNGGSTALLRWGAVSPEDL